MTLLIARSPPPFFPPPIRKSLPLSSGMVFPTVRSLPPFALADAVPDLGVDAFFFPGFIVL